MKRDQRGMTMIELLAAMAVLATLGVFLARLMGSAFDLYDQGDSRGAIHQIAQGHIEALQTDLRAVHGGPGGRLLVEPDRFGPGTLLVRLVRSIQGGELDHPALRRAGTSAQPTQSYAGGEVRAAESAAIRPPSGLIEVFWALIQDPRDPVGVLSLWRAEQAPALEGPQSFFSADFDERLTPELVQQRAQALGSDVLGLWVLGLGQRSRDFEEDAALAGRPAGDGALPAWDSTRGRLDRSRFGLAVGPSSADDERDDVFPRQVRIVLAVGRGRRPETALAEGLTGESGFLRVRSDRRLPPEDALERYVKVQNEWLRLAGSGGRIGIARGQRGSRVSGILPPGTEVFVGHHFRATFALPAAKSYWLSENG